MSCCRTKHVGKCLHHLKIAFCCKYLTVCGLLVKAIVSRWVCINFQLFSIVKPLHMMPVRRCLFSQHTDACSHHIHCGGVQILTAVHPLDTFRNIQLSDWLIHVLACSNPIDGRTLKLKFDSIYFQNILFDKTSLYSKERIFLILFFAVVLFSPFPSVWYFSDFYHSMYGKHLQYAFQLVYCMMKLVVHIGI